jgi:flagellar biosynthesis/type III secretory pathway chaperone
VLTGLLESEFTALQARQLDDFETLQSQKEALIARISTIDLDRCASFLDQPDTPDASRALWQDIGTRTSQCQQMQKRNEILMDKKLQVVRDTLRALQYPGRPAEQTFYGPRGKLTSKP